MATEYNNFAVLNTQSRPVTEQNARDLILATTAAEILTEFDRQEFIGPRVMNYPVFSGDRVRILSTGSQEVRELRRGQRLEGSDARLGTRYLRIGNPLAWAWEEWDFDNIINDFNVRSEFVRKAGQAFAQEFDYRNAATVLRSSLLYINRNASTGAGDIYDESQAIYLPPWHDWTPDKVDFQLQNYDGHPGGTALGCDADNATVSTGVIELYNAIVKASEVFDYKNVPEGMRWGVMSPTMFNKFLIARNSDLLQVMRTVNFDAPSIAGPGGSLIQTMEIAGFTIFKTNRIPTASKGYDGDTAAISNNELRHTKFASPWGALRCMLWNPECAAYAMKKAVGFETDREIRTQSDVMVATAMGGHDVLRTGCAVSIFDETALAANTNRELNRVKAAADHAAKVFESTVSYDQSA